MKPIPENSKEADRVEKITLLKENPITFRLLKKAKVLAFSLGFIQFLATFVLTASASDLADKFNQKELMPLFYSQILLSSMLFRVINAKFLLKVRHKVRILISEFVISVGISLFIFSYFFETFSVCIISLTFVGIGQALGDSVLDGFSKAFPPEVIAFKVQG